MKINIQKTEQVEVSLPAYRRRDERTMYAILTDKKAVKVVLSEYGASIETFSTNIVLDYAYHVESQEVSEVEFSQHYNAALKFINNQFNSQPEPWKPKKGELCWFWNYGQDKTARLGRFDQMKVTEYVCLGFNGFEYCAPFTGSELPPNMQEVKP